MDKILIVEDNMEIQNMETELLRKSGYETVSAFSGTEALLLLEKEQFDLVLLDLMLPGLAGEEVLAKIREQSDMGVLCVSALEAVETKVKLMRLGADDYIVKPFENSELLVRMEAILRRVRRNKGETKSGGDTMTFKDIVVESENHIVTVAGQQLELTKKEYEILELLMRNPNKVFTKENIYESVWGDSYMPEDNAVNVHVSNLRKKLVAAGKEEEYIKTVWGIGFKMAL